MVCNHALCDLRKHEPSQTAGHVLIAVVVADVVRRYSLAFFTAVVTVEAASVAASGTFWLLIESPAGFAVIVCHNTLPEQSGVGVQCRTVTL